MKWPSKSQWGQFSKILTRKEKIIFSVFLFLFVVSFSFLSVNFYFKNTEPQAAKVVNILKELLAFRDGLIQSLLLQMRLTKI